MSHQPRPEGDWSRRLIKEYIVGLALGTICAAYGVVALMMKQTFLPGVKSGNSMVTGAHGAGVAIAYLSGGLYLFCRFFLHGRCRSETARGQIYLVENLLLALLIGAMAYVLWQVGTVG